jgi:glycosyltransferase involved in cell wall biosynthesis
MKSWRCWRVVAADRIRYSPLMQRILGFAHLALAVAQRRGSKKLARLARAHRILLPVGGSSLSAGRLAPTVPKREGTSESAGNLWRDPATGWGRYRSKSVDGGFELSHSLIIKPPVSEKEKGVLVVWVEYNLASLLRVPSLPAILRSYRIVFSTSWSPPDLALIWALAGEPDADLWVIGSNSKDADWLREIPAPFSVLPFYASHWICGDDYADVLESSRDYDFCIVGNWAPFKRHWTLFEALRKLPAEIRIALIGQPEGPHTVEEMQELAKAFGVRQEIDWCNRLDPADVRRIQASSRACLMLSLREGSCLAVVESLLADTPVGMFTNAHVGSLDFINEKTGIRLVPERLSEDLSRLLERQKQGAFSPRDWALENAEARRSSEMLSSTLGENAVGSNSPWTKGTIPFCLRRARPDYIDPDQWGEAKAWHDQFEAEYGVRFIWPTTRKKSEENM